jgi:hypothetical protein
MATRVVDSGAEVDARLVNDWDLKDSAMILRVNSRLDRRSSMRSIFLSLQQVSEPLLCDNRSRAYYCAETRTRARGSGGREVDVRHVSPDERQFEHGKLRSHRT